LFPEANLAFDQQQQSHVVLPQETPNINYSNPMDTSMVGSGSNTSQSLSNGKTALETMDQIDSPSQRTIK
jgi:hypothetical protein